MKTIRAYSVLDIKSFDEVKRTFEGIATTVTPDRMEDVVEPKGGQFSLPLPFLYQHQAWQVIGSITDAKVTDEGIRVKGFVENLPDAPPTLRDRLDTAWAEMKAKLVRGLSIGFNPLELSYIKETGGFRFIRWEWLELSLVTIPANAEATITTVKSFDVGLRAATGRHTREGVRLIGHQSPDASGARDAARLRGAVKLIPR